MSAMSELDTVVRSLTPTQWVMLRTVREMSQAEIAWVLHERLGKPHTIDVLLGLELLAEDGLRRTPEGIMPQVVRLTERGRLALEWKDK